MWDMFSRIQRIAPHYRTVLVTGATGTGKDLVASAVHRLSPVHQGNFVVLNCSAVVETLFESELFGHMRGAFTGAAGDKVGLFEHAHKGTLFLDEIGDMPMSTQAKLLRAIQNQEVQRLGSLTPRKVDVRIVAATNRELRKLLIRHFLRKFSTLYNKPIRGLTRRAEVILQRHTWPGNVRELENVLGNSCMMVLGETIDVQDLPPYLSSHGAHASSNVVAMPASGEQEMAPLEEQEKSLIAQALEKSGGNQTQAARLLRISRDTLRYRMKKHGLA
jgi:transcriptional regulator with PAS, ATPase and Fis domain